MPRLTALLLLGSIVLAGCSSEPPATGRPAGYPKLKGGTAGIDKPHPGPGKPLSPAKK